jgi:hypothetical protein
MDRECRGSGDELAQSLRGRPAGDDLGAVLQDHDQPALVLVLAERGHRVDGDEVGAVDAPEPLRVELVLELAEREAEEELLAAQVGQGVVPGMT